MTNSDDEKKLVMLHVGRYFRCSDLLITTGNSSDMCRVIGLRADGRSKKILLIINAWLMRQAKRSDLPVCILFPTPNEIGLSSEITSPFTVT